MATKLEPIEGTAPSHWAPYLINGDSSGMEQDDIRQADAFVQWLGATPVSCEDAGFLRRHDAYFVCGTLAADCQTYVALIEVES